jgi:hypothetical protein
MIIARSVARQGLLLSVDILALDACTCDGRHAVKFRSMARAISFTIVRVATRKLTRL